MADVHGPYHRLGEPGGPGCSVASLQIIIKNTEGNPEPAELLDAGDAVTEVEILRTVAQRFGVKWGHDEFGWWAVVPLPKPPKKKKWLPW